MIYNKKEIGIPDINQVQECTRKCGYKYNAFDCYAWLKSKEWKTNKGEEFKTLESACTIYNSIYIAKKKNSQIKTTLFQPPSYINSPYKEQLLDKRWRLFREFAITARGGKCENCGSKKHLVIHHPQYVNSYNAWDYSVRDVVCLCEQCHKNIHGIKT